MIHRTLVYLLFIIVLLFIGHYNFYLHAAIVAGLLSMPGCMLCMCVRVCGRGAWMRIFVCVCLCAAY